MLIESATSTAPTTDAPAGPDAPAPAPRREPTLVHDAAFGRAARALDALDELARRRRSQELVLALERLGAGLESTIDALDDAVAPSVAAPTTPTPAPASSWTPISTPVVPITAHVPEPGSPVGVAGGPVASTPAVPSAPRPTVEAEAPRPMRQAPAGLEAYVIDFSAPGGA